MIIDVIVCHLDGTQELEHREVPDDCFEEIETPQPGTENE